MSKFLLDLNDFTEQLLDEISRYRVSFLVVFCVILDWIFAIIFSLLLFPDVKNPFVLYSLLEKLILAVIIAPVLETYLVQGYILRKTYTFSGNKFIAILVSALLFGVAHVYPAPPIALKAFLAGMLYATLFFAMQKKKKKNPLLFVILAHALYNLTVISVNYFL